MSPVGCYMRVGAGVKQMPINLIDSFYASRTRDSLRNDIINPLLKNQLIKYTIPEKPNSRLQKYKLTEKGRVTLKKIEEADN